MKTTAGSAACAGGAPIPPHTKNDPAAAHAAANCSKLRRRSSAPRSLRTVVIPCWSLSSSSSVERTAPHPLHRAQLPYAFRDGKQIARQQGPPCQSLRPKRGRFEHGTGAAVKALGGPSGELEQQRAGSVAKKKAGRAG